MTARASEEQAMAHKMAEKGFKRPLGAILAQVSPLLVHEDMALSCELTVLTGGPMFK